MNKHWHYTFFSILLLNLCTITQSFAQCEEPIGVVWKGKSNIVDLSTIAESIAPMLWFSPDEPDLKDDRGNIQIPEPLPHDTPSSKPVVYYKVKVVYVGKEEKKSQSSDFIAGTKLNLNKAKALDIEFYFYYSKETGLGGHPHDLESVLVQLQVSTNHRCPDFRYAIAAKKVIARAHGLYWFENAFKVDAQTKFPLSIMVEEGKHANCTDKNADGIYTPSFDVTEKVNDAWGVRDIISSGKLFSGGYQAWMTKQRDAKSLLFPPLPANSDYYRELFEKYGSWLLTQNYELRPFLDDISSLTDKKLAKMIKSKKPNNWPKEKRVSGDGSILQWSKENKLYKKIGISYRFDEDQGISLALPLLLFKNVEAPLTGGWFYHKVYFGQGDTYQEELGRTFGHQIQHTTSASRWLDTYIGAGYEIIDRNRSLDVIDNKTFFVSEIGMKIRFNITKTPLAFFKYLGTEYWGLRFGWKNIGYNPFLHSGFVIEIGAGVF